MILRTVIIIVTIVIVIVGGYLLLRGNNPEDASGHAHSGPETDSDRFYGGSSRPAGPDAEADGVLGPGQIGPNAQPPGTRPG